MKLFFIIILTSITSVTFAQTKDPFLAKPFEIFIDGGIGYAKNVSPGIVSSASGGGTYTNGGISTLVRVRGSRNRFITFGLESGWQYISHLEQRNATAVGFGNTDITATLSGIPIMGVVTIQDYHIELHASVGFYDLISHSTTFNTPVTSSTVDMAFTLAGGYQIPMGNNYILVPEFRWTRINDLQKSFLTLAVRLRLPPLTL